MATIYLQAFDGQAIAVIDPITLFISFFLYYSYWLVGAFLMFWAVKHIAKV